jgi:DNA-binding NarL/FixJ family response regulator
VLRPLARGRSNKEIGPALGISARTTGHHIAHIHDTIGSSSRARALFATEHGGFL